MSFVDLTDSDREGISEFLQGGAALPNDFRTVVGSQSLVSTISGLRTAAATLLKDSYGSGEYSTVERRKSAMLLALARDLDHGAAGDRTLRAHGFNGRLRAAYETGRGGLDNI